MRCDDFFFGSFINYIIELELYESVCNVQCDVSAWRCKGEERVCYT